MIITIARKEQSKDIAALIMKAMNYECCKNFAGPDHSLDDFNRMLIRLVEREDSQYSYRNTIVAMNSNSVVGIIVSYDGGMLHELRKAFIDEAKKEFGIDYSNTEDETQKEELYIDSLAVSENYRNLGVATALIKEVIKKSNILGLKNTGLLVDIGNPKAEKLYTSIGFKYIDNKCWGGHNMKHLQY